MFKSLFKPYQQPSMKDSTHHSMVYHHKVCTGSNSGSFAKKPNKTAKKPTKTIGMSAIGSTVFGATVLGTSILLLASCTTTSGNTVDSSTTKTALPDPVKTQPVIALVLGGGGAKGFAHVGVIKTLEENGIKPDLVVGTSVGSIIGSIYASGMSPAKLEQLALNTDNEDLTDITLSYQGIIEGAKLRQFVNTNVDNQRIEDFPTPFAAVAAEKHTLKKAVFDKGEAGLAVQASSSVPNIFIAPRIPEKVGKKYIDGGVISIVPVDAAKALGADVTIAVDLQAHVSNGNDSNGNSSASGKTSPGIRPSRQDNFWQLIEKGYGEFSRSPIINSPSSSAKADKVDYQKLNKAEIARADILIRPYQVEVNPLDTTRRTQSIQAGADATIASLPQIRTAIKQAQSKYK